MFFFAPVVVCGLFSKLFFFYSKSLPGTLSECVTVWIPDQDWRSLYVHTVGKDYQQATKVAASKESVKLLFKFKFFLLKL